MLLLSCKFARRHWLIVTKRELQLPCFNQTLPPCPCSVRCPHCPVVAVVATLTKGGQIAYLYVLGVGIVDVRDGQHNDDGSR